MPPTLTPHAKAIIAAVVAVVVSGVTAYQSVTAGHFRLIDLVPVVVVVVGAIQTKLIPNVPELPWAKAAINVAAAVTGAVSTLVAADPSGVTFAKIAAVAVGAFLVWFVPEAAPAVDLLEPSVADWLDGPKHAAPEPVAPVAPAPVTSTAGTVTVNVRADTSQLASDLAAASAAVSSMATPDLPLDATQPIPAVTDPAPAAPAATVPNA